MQFKRESWKDMEMTSCNKSWNIGIVCVLTFYCLYNSCISFKVLLRSKNIVIFSLDFETLFTKQSPCEILGLNFEKKTVYSNYNFPI